MRTLSLYATRASVLFFAGVFVITAITAAVPMQAQTTKSYIPALQPADAAELELALVNPTPAQAAVTLTARRYDGSIIQNQDIANPVTLTVPASGQKALRAADIFGSGISEQIGWVEVSASTPALKGFFLVYDSRLSFMEETGWTSTPSSRRLIFPKVSTDGTRLTLVNTAPQAMDGTIMLYDNSGRLAGVWGIALAGLAGFSGALSELAPVEAGFEGYAVVDSATGSSSLIGLETYRDRSDIAMLRAFPESAVLRTGYLAHFASQGGYSATLNLVNTSDQPQVLQIMAGGIASPVTVERTLPPNGRLAERVDQMFNLSGDALINGYIHFSAQNDAPGVIGFLELSSSDGLALSAIEAQGEASSNLILSRAAEGSASYTGLTLLNPNAEPSMVALDAFDAAGNPAGSAIVSLGAQERGVRLLDQFQGSAGEPGGYIRISSTRPIFALQLFGSLSSSTLVATTPLSLTGPAPYNATEVTVPPGAVTNRHPDQASGSGAIALPGTTLNPAARFERITLAPDAATSLMGATGLMAAYGLNEGSGGLTSDASGNANTATLNSASWTTGKIANAVSFNGSSSFVEAPDTDALTPGTAATFEAWVYLNAAPSEIASVLNKWSQTVDDEYLVGINPNRTIFFAWHTSGSDAYGKTSYNDLSGAAVIPLNTWTHIALVRNGATITSYINGVQDISRSAMDTNPFRNGINTLRIGGQGRGAKNRYFNGKIDEARIYNRALAQAEVQSDMATPIGSVTNQAPTVSAGSNQTITLPASATLNGTATDDGLPTGTLTTTWSKVSGPGTTVTFGNLTARSTTASFSTSGSYVLRLTASDGALSSSSDITITVNPPAPVTSVPGKVAAYALSEGTGSVTADVFGNTGTLQGAAWTTGKYGNGLAFNGNGYVEAADTNALTPGTTASFEAWVYLNSTPTELVSVINKWDQTLNDEYLFGIMPSQTLFFAWHTTGGDVYGTGSYNDASGAQVIPLNTWTHVALVRNGSTISFYVGGNLDSSLTVMDTNPFRGGANTLRIGGQGRGTKNRFLNGKIDEVQIYNSVLTQAQLQSDLNTPLGSVTSTNQSPVVSAGPNQPITLPASATLNGTATDDGLPNPPGTLTTTWSKLSGPGTVTFGNPGAKSTTASFSAAGTYVLRLSATDSALSSTSDITITVNPVLTLTNQPPVVSAGSNQTITLSSSVTLSGTATDDGLPNPPGTLTTTWSKVSGPGTVAFGNASAKNTTASFSAAGTYVLRLTASDSALSSTSDVTISVNATSGTMPGMTDSVTHMPPTSGTYAYDTFKPNAAGFPGLGQTYVDPIFGSTIRRLTKDFPLQSTNDIYGKNGFWNADGTRFMYRSPTDYRIIDTTTGAAVRTDVPAGDNGVIASDASFDPVDPDAWYYFSGSSLMKYSLSSGTSSTIKTFSGTLHQVAGGAENWIDRTGRYFLVSYDDGSRHPVAHLWDKQTNTIYASSLDSTFVEADNGYLALTPDAKYIVAAGSGGSSRSHYSYPIDHTNKSISSTGTFFWSLCGQHGAFVSASNGKDYYFSYDCDYTPAVYRVDITIPQTAADFNKQHNDNLKLVDLDWKDDDPHFSCTAKGSNSDWCFFNTETSDDLFNNMGPWRPYKQEIIGVNVITGEVRRLAHHRSRNIPSSYYYQPRLCASWDGTKVAWASNYDYDAKPTQYADIYAVNLPALLASDSTVAPSNLFAKLETEDNNVGWSSQIRTGGAEEVQIGDRWVSAAYLDQATPHSSSTAAEFTPDSGLPVQRRVLAIGRRRVFQPETA